MTPRILVVDDNVINLDLIRKILHLEGYEVIIAESGVEALEKIQLHKPDLALLDVIMPDMNGYELCRRVRQLPEGKTIPVIMLTAASSETDRKEAIGAGATDMIGKPFDMDSLRTYIHSLL
jgi:CheY-like chemotaxis protein